MRKGITGNVAVLLIAIGLTASIVNCSKAQSSSLTELEKAEAIHSQMQQRLLVAHAKLDPMALDAQWQIGRWDAILRACNEELTLRQSELEHWHAESGPDAQRLSMECQRRIEMMVNGIGVVSARRESLVSSHRDQLMRASAVTPKLEGLGRGNATVNWLQTELAASSRPCQPVTVETVAVATPVSCPPIQWIIDTGN